MVRTGPFKLALIITLIMGIALGFLYLIERQKLYNSIKENSRNLANQEFLHHQQLGVEWNQTLTRLVSHNNLRLYLSALAKNPADVPKVYVDSLAKVFTEYASYQSNLIHRISLISLEGEELVSSLNESGVEIPKNWFDFNFFREVISRPANKLQNNQFHVQNSQGFIHKMMPVSVSNKKIAVIALTVLAKDIVDKYQYLLAATINDQIVVVTKQGMYLTAYEPEAVNKEELNKVFTALKQKPSNDPIMEYHQNVWSFIRNDDQHYYVMFESKGEKITQLLNDEYAKLSIVFFVSSFIMIILVFITTRRFQRQQAKKESEKVIHTQRSHHFASISDEIRLPLNSLMGALVTLEEVDPEKKTNPYLDSAKKTALQISELVNEFTDFARINDGEFQLEPIEFDLRTTLNDIADLMSVQASDKGLDISCLVSSDTPRRVRGDATRLRQVLINLISFAIKYTDYGEISLCLSVEEHSDSEKLVNIDVSDTGNIIDQESMIEHFKMFTDPEYFNREDNTGEGLGLALSKQLVNLMRGDITVKENASGGNTFRVSLPMPIIEIVSTEAPKDNLKGKRVLIIGEIENNRQMLSHALSKWGMSGGTMDDFSRVVNVLQEAQAKDKAYHACLIDVSLSSLSEKAFDLVRKIRKEFDELNMGIIILTVQGEPGDAKRAKKSGAQAFLTKPMTRSSMKEVLLRIFDARIDKPVEFITRHTLKEGRQDTLVRILVADSDDSVQKGVVKHFDNNHYQVDFARDGSALESAMNQNVYDMILLDAALPNVDIFAYVKKFRQYEKNLNTALNVSTGKLVRLPIVAMVPEVTQNLTERCEKYGLDHLIAKPVNKALLEQLVSQFLSSKNKK